MSHLLDTWRFCVTLRYTNFRSKNGSQLFFTSPHANDRASATGSGILPGSARDYLAATAGILTRILAFLLPHLQTYYGYLAIIYLNTKINTMTSKIFPHTKTYFKIYYSPQYKLYDFTVFDITNDQVIYHYHFSNLKQINKLIQEYKWNTISNY